MEQFILLVDFSKSRWCNTANELQWPPPFRTLWLLVELGQDGLLWVNGAKFEGQSSPSQSAWICFAATSESTPHNKMSSCPHLSNSTPLVCNNVVSNDTFMSYQTCHNYVFSICKYGSRQLLRPKYDWETLFISFSESFNISEWTNMEENQTNMNIKPLTGWVLLRMTNKQTLMCKCKYYSWLGCKHLLMKKVWNLKKKTNI